MDITYRVATHHDLPQLKNLAIKTWSQFQSKLTDENWKKLYNNLADDRTYTELLANHKAL